MAEAKDTVLVTSATGTLGSLLVPALVKSNAFGQVRAATRDAKSPASEALAKQGASVVEVDFDNQDSINNAAKGVTTVVFISPLSEFHQAVTEQWVKSLQTNAGTITHIVRLSALGADDPQTLLGRWHALDEVLVKTLDIPYTIVRPTFFAQHMYTLAGIAKANKGLHCLPLGNTSITMIDAADVAEVIRTILQNKAQYAGKELNLRGVQSVSQKEVAKYFADASGNKVEYIAIPADQYRGVMSGWLGDVMADIATETYVEATKNALYQEPDKSVEAVIGRAASTIDDFVARNKAALA